MNRVRVLVALLALTFVAAAVQARIGGGDSYSGPSSGSSSSSSGSSSGSYGGSSGGSSYDHPSSGGSSSGGSSSGGGSSGTAGFEQVFIGFIFLLIVGVLVFKADQSREWVTVTSETAAPPSAPQPVTLTPLRRFDPNFSEIVFTDFCYSLFARVHEARGRQRLDDLAPYVSAPVREGMKGESAAVSSVDEIVIGSFTVIALRSIGKPWVEVDVDFEANYTEATRAGNRRWYVLERWTLERARDILSPAPGKATADHCPNCGAALETRTGGACLHCGTVITRGTFQWFVRSIAVLRRDEQQPQLGGTGVETGTDWPTVYQPWVGRKLEELAKLHPDFTPQAFDARVREVAVALQDAWTTRDWHRARPYETGALFQMHRYWIDEYRRQGLQNVVDSFEVGAVEVVKVTSDAFYDAITVRLFASGYDYTVDEAGTVVGGSREEGRSWSEYWTFIRGRAGAADDAKVCPNCGGARADGQTVICEYCGGQIVTGDFPWVLSRIEQDEAYRG
jgi:hypothetical protein